MSILRLKEFGKFTKERDGSQAFAQVVVNADGSKPRMFATFDDTLNELVGEVVLATQWQESYPCNYTIGKVLRRDYADALQMKRGMFVLKAQLTETNHFDLQLDFIDSSKDKFETLSFSDIKYDPFKSEIYVAKYDNDDYNVFLEEVLGGILEPAFKAVTDRCMTKYFVNRIYYGFTLNKYGVPLDVRNRSLQLVCG